jgi:hypothetical protein
MVDDRNSGRSQCHFLFQQTRSVKRKDRDGIDEMTTPQVEAGGFIHLRWATDPTRSVSFFALLKVDGEEEEAVGLFSIHRLISFSNFRCGAPYGSCCNLLLAFLVNPKDSLRLSFGQGVGFVS